MSRWTHINGSIRVDGIHGITPMLNFKEIFKTASYEDDETKWEVCNVPKGSEGSIEINVWTNPTKSSLALYTINIWGDLRDFGTKEDIDGVRDWFTKTCKKLGPIRQAILQINDENEENSCVLTYKEI